MTNKIELYSKAIDNFVHMIKKVNEERENDIKNGKYVNVFSLWNDISGITEPIHSRILQFFLSTNPMHGQGKLFLLLFLKRLGIDAYEKDEWITTAEIGRVDVLLKRFHPHSVVIIENKSNWAGDQPNQLYRYWFQNIHRNENDCYPSYYEKHSEYKIVYLVPNEYKSLSDFSLKKPLDYPENLPDILPIKPIIFSFNKEIYDWLTECAMSLPSENTPLFNMISQYKEYCKNL